MRTLLLATLFLVPALVLAPPASATDGHPRRARAMRLLAAPSPAILLGPDRAWMPEDGSEAPLSVCAGERCRAVSAIEACELPRCPGHGRLMTLVGGVAEVSGYPGDREAMNREREAIAQDPELAALVGYLPYQSEPPRAPPPEWGDDDVRWEVSAAVGASYLAASGVGTGELVLGGGARFPIDWGNSDDDDFFGVLMGNWLGADLRVHVMPNLLGQTFDEYAIAVGVAPTFGMTPRGEVLRLPSVWGVLIPELGLIARGDRDAALYVQWNAAMAVLLDRHVAVEARASVMVIDDWVEGDDAEAILGLSLAVTLR